MPAAWVGLAAAAVGAVGSITASGQQSSAANKATDAQQAMFQQTFDAGAPYRQVGSQATSKLSDLLGISGNPLTPGYGSLTQPFTAADYLANKDPGYEFQLNQGQQALQNSQAAQGGVLSGAALKSLINYNQGVASTGYQSAWDRWNAQQTNTVNRLGSLAQLGQAASTNSATGASSFSNGIANTITGAGNAAAAGTVGATNAVNSGLGYYYLSQNGGGGGSIPGFNGNASSGYTNQAPWTVGPTGP